MISISEIRESIRTKAAMMDFDLVPFSYGSKRRLKELILAEVGVLDLTRGCLLQRNDESGIVSRIGLWCVK